MTDHGARRTFFAVSAVVAVVVGATLVGGGDASAAAKKYGWASVGSAAALANPNCNKDIERVKEPFELSTTAGRVNGFSCVTEFPDGADNGGATSQGVTKDAIKIVYFNSTTDTGGMNTADAFRDYIQMYGWLNTETYGRRIEVVEIRASGSDEAAQRADAVKVAELKPFMVVDGPGSGGVYFDSELAKRKIISLGYSVTPESGKAQQPYRYGLNPDIDALQANVASVAAPLVGKKAQWAGDDKLKSQTRKFAVIAPSTLDGAKIFVQQFKKVGGTASAFEYEYLPSSFVSSTDSYADELPTYVSRMKADGITTVVVFGDLNFIPLITKLATTQEFRPEWLMTGFQYQDIDAFSRSTSALGSPTDQEQWKHAFGMGTLGPDTSASARVQAFYRYYWGPDRPNFSSGRDSGPVSLVYSGIALAGPDLTPQTYQKGLFEDPNGYLGDRFLPWTSYQAGGLAGRLLWWDPAAKGPSNAVALDGTGKYQYLFDAQQYLPGKFPKKVPPYFDAAQSVLVKPTPVVGPLYPCTGCPSQTGRA